MKAGALYGLFLGVFLAVARAVGPAMWTPLFIAIACQLACFAVITWRRTRLPFMTAGASLAAFAGLALGLVGERDYETLLFTHPVQAVAVVLVFPLLMFSERWAHPDIWRRLKARAEDATLRDMLLFRHIPDLRKH